jgi:hypothetical protein
MNYNTILSLIFGGLIKTYDDIFDNKKFGEYFSELNIELIKNFTICIYTLISVKNFNIPFIILISHLLLYLIDKESLNNPFFVSGMLITVFLCIFSFSFNKDVFNLNTSLLSILAMITILWIDHIMFPEESSIKKILGRILILTGSILLFYNFSDYFIKDIAFFCFGYLTTSIINMSIMEMNNIPDTVIDEKKD